MRNYQINDVLFNSLQRQIVEAGILSVNMDQMNVMETKYRLAFLTRWIIHNRTKNQNEQCFLTWQVPDPSEHIPLLNCIMSTESPPYAADLCLATLGIMTTSPADVTWCAVSGEGAMLLHDIGVETLGLEPPLTGVPWLLFNNVMIRLILFLMITLAL